MEVSNQPYPKEYLVSSLSDSLKELKEPTKKPSNFKIWLDSLSDSDKTHVLTSMQDSTIKNYPLFETFKKHGMHVSKDYFFDIRRKLQEGKIDSEGIR